MPLGSNPAVALPAALAVFDRLLAERARRQPAILVLEDLQAMDPASLELAQDQARSPGDRAVLLVLTSRGSLPLKDFEGERLELAPWDAPTVARAALREFGAELLDHELEELLVRQSQGNPLLLRELCRHLVASGKIEISPYGQAYLQAAAGEELPGSLEALMLARLDRLPAPTRQVLQVASCLGTEFELALLASAASLDAPSAPDDARAAGPDAVRAAIEALQPAADAGLVLLRAAEDRAAFAQPVLRETVHAALSRVSRRTLHRAIAEELTRLEAAGRPVPSAQLAYHWDLAERKPQAYDASKRAAEAALRQGLNPEALLHLERAITLLGSTSLRPHRADLPEVLEKRAQAHLVIGNPEQAAEDARRLIRIATRKKDVEAEAQGWLLLARAEVESSRYPDARRAVRRTLQAARKARLPVLIGTAHLIGGKLNVLQGNFDQARTDLGEALHFARKAGDRLTLAEIHNQLAQLHARTGNLAAARLNGKLALQSFEAAEDLHGQALTLPTLAFVALNLQDFRQSIQFSTRLLDLSRHIGSRVSEAAAHQYLYLAFQPQGKLDAAEESLRQSIAAYHRAGNVGGIATCTNNLAVLLHVRRRLDEAESVYIDALKLLEKSGNFSMLCIGLNNLGELHEDRGQLERATVFYQRSLELSRKMSDPTQEAVALLGMARHAAHSGDASRTRNLLQACCSVARRANLSETLQQAASLLAGLPPES